MTTTTDVIDSDGTNATASFLLNDHHKVDGYSAYGDDIMDECLRCGFAAGWVQPTVLGPDEAGHATAATSDEVRAWIEQQT